MSNILFLSASPEMLDADHGGRQRSYNLLNALTREHNVTVLALSWNKKKSDRQIEKNLRFIVTPVESQVVRAYKANKNGLINNSPDVSIYFYSRYLKEYNRDMNVIAAKSDLIIVDHYSIVPIIKHLKVNVPIYYSSHNCETDLARQLYPLDSKDLKTINDMERLAFEKCNVFSYCSIEDIKHIKNNFIIQKPSYYIPNGTDLPNNIVAGSNFDKKDILFVGSGHPPNWVAVKRIIEIAKLVPEYRFIIAGTASYIVDQEKIKLPDNVKRYDHITNDKVDKLFNSAFAFINPVEQGSGTHLKIIKSLAYGLPTITTSVGARGYSDHDKLNTLLVGETNDDMIKIIKGLSDKDKYTNISKNSITLSKEYDWEIIKNKFLDSVNDVIKKRIYEEKEMVTKDILVYSIMRNEAGYIDKYHQQLKSLVEAFPEHRFYLSVYENDSTDDTKSKLAEKDWSFFKDTSFIHETLNTVFYRSTKEEDRVKNLSIARNKAIEAKDFLNKCDYIMMVEGDVEYSLDTAKKVLRFTEQIPDFDVVSGITIRSNRLYDVWATRTGPEYIKGVLPLYDDHYLKSYDKYYSTSNGICIYNAKPFQDGVRYHWINTETKQSDCEMVVVCQKLHELGRSNIYIIYDAKIYHEHF